MNPKTLVIVNPAAGGGRGKKVWPRIQTGLRESLGDFEVRWTEGAGDALKKAEGATDAQTVIACGGDGTLHEVANGLFRQERPPHGRPALGILSTGTGGDLIKSLRIPKNLERQIEILKRGNTKEIDVGKIGFANNGTTETRIFLNIVDAGLGADVLKRLASSRAILGKKLAYLFAAVRAYARRECHEMEIVVDGERGWTEAPLIVAFANGQYFGGGMRFAPQADLSDGMMEITLLKDFPPVWLFAVIPSLYGKIERLPQITMRRARKVEVLSRHPVPLDIDGEQIGTLPLTVEMIPRALKVIAP